MDTFNCICSVLFLKLDNGYLPFIYYSLCPIYVCNFWSLDAQNWIFFSNHGSKQTIPGFLMFLFFLK